MNPIVNLFFKSPAFMGWHFLIGLLLLAAALFFQYVLGLQPCELCVFQRVVFSGVLIISLFGLLVSNRILNSLSILALILLYLVSIYLAIYQTNIEKGLVISVCRLDSIFPTWFALDSWLPWVFKPNAACSEVSWYFFGFSMAELLAFCSSVLALWSLVAFGISFKKDSTEKNLYHLDI